MNFNYKYFDILKDRRQQTAKGKLVEMIDHDFLGFRMLYEIDTTGGNSGSAIILEEAQKIIGIHIEGGCDFPGQKYNKATPISENPLLANAIKSCLNSDY